MHPEILLGRAILMATVTSKMNTPDSASKIHSEYFVEQKTHSKGFLHFLPKEVA